MQQLIERAIANAGGHAGGADGGRRGGHGDSRTAGARAHITARATASNAIQRRDVCLRRGRSAERDRERQREDITWGVMLDQLHDAGGHGEQGAGARTGDG